MQSKDVEYAALVTRNPKTLEEMSQLCRVPKDRCFTNLDLALKTVEAHAVLVTTPFFAHFEPVLKSLHAEKHVLLEKPMADTMINAMRMVQLAERVGKILMVAEDYRYRSSAITVRKLIEQGVIGKPQMVICHYFRHHKFSSEDWRMQQPYILLVENGVHHFDLLRYLISCNAKTCFCDTWVPLNGNWQTHVNYFANFEMEDGCRASFLSSWAYEQPETPWEGTWWIYGSDGSLYWSGERIDLINPNGWRKPVQLVGGVSEDSIASVLLEFVLSIKTGKQPRTSGKDNFFSFVMAIAAIEASKVGCKVEIAELLQSENVNL